MLNQQVDARLKRGVNQLSTSGGGHVVDAALALKTTVVGAITYAAEAEPGSTQAAAVWRVSRVDTTTGTVITWADGNSNFDNVATNLTTLTYS